MRCDCLLPLAVKCSFRLSVGRHGNPVPSQTFQSWKHFHGPATFTFQRGICDVSLEKRYQKSLFFFWGMIFHCHLNKQACGYLCWGPKNQLFSLQENVSDLLNPGAQQHLGTYFCSIISWLLFFPQTSSPLELWGLWRKGSCLSCPLASQGRVQCPVHRTCSVVDEHSPRARHFYRNMS